MLFGRRVIVQFGPKGGGVARSIEGLRVAFAIQMTEASGPYQGSIQVWNPAGPTVGAARDDRNEIRLIAGYDVPGLIFRGPAVPGGVRVQKQGADRVLTYEAADGWRSLAETTIAVSFARPTTAAQVVAEVLREAGLPQGSIRVPPGLTFERGIALAGTVREVLDDLTDALGATWRITDGAVNLHPEDEAVRVGERGPLISGRSGNLIGSPTERINDGRSEIEVTALLTPSMRPFQAFRVESDEVSGDFVARNVTHQGDSGFDRPFYTVITGTPR